MRAVIDGLEMAVDAIFSFVLLIQFSMKMTFFKEGLE